MQPVIGAVLALLWVFVTACGGASQTRDLMPAMEQGAGAWTGAVDYARDIRPILNHRCVICHGCYDAPCQLKLESKEGLERGASKEPVYAGGRVLATDPTRLFEDGLSTEQWRQKGFFAVTNQTALPVSTETLLSPKPRVRDIRRQAVLQNISGSLLGRFLLLKREHPQPESPRLPDSINLDLERGAMCPLLSEFDDFKTAFPLWGMPYALPQLPQHEFAALMRWIGEGSPVPTQYADLDEDALDAVQMWEDFLNGDSLKERLVSRYIYEHFFLANIYFGDMDAIGDQRQFFQLVRSRTAAPHKVERIATRRPFDDPGTDRVYYRFVPVREVIVAKRHLPMRFDEDRLEHYRELFLETNYKVSALPGYEAELAANPFVVYQDIPARIRYSFMLEEAHFYINGFIKGPVCRGQLALDVINDRFWVIFANPQKGMNDAYTQFLRQQAGNLILPARDGSNVVPGVRWWKYASAHYAYLLARGAYQQKVSASVGSMTMRDIWDGDQSNQNAALTVFRHFDSASVVRGLVGEVPKTAWLIDYPLLERIHYLLVAGFDVFGNIGHKLHTRLYMDLLRLEGESNFLALLPKAVRESEWKFWYRGAEDELEEYQNIASALWARRLGIVYESGVSTDAGRDKSALFARVKDRLGDANAGEYILDKADAEEIVEPLRLAAALPATAINLLPETALLSVRIPGEKLQLFSLLHNAGHSNIAYLFAEDERRIFSEDSLTLVPGIVGSYPNVLLQVQQKDLAAFVSELGNMRDEGDYSFMLDRYGVRRTDQRFWRYIDDVQARYRQMQPVRSGILDFSRLENR